MINAGHRTLPDFDALVELAETDPPALEALRDRLTNQVIKGATSTGAQRRLRGLKFRIDAERRRSSDPMTACLRISKLMYESLAELKWALEAPDALLAERRQAPHLTKHAAKPIAFPRQRR
jgi:hypothetical protein